MNWFRSARFLLLFAVMVALAVPAYPQGSTATVGGTVRDLSGAVVPAADVLLINTGTDSTLRSKTNEVGYYFFAGVIPGAYRVRVESAGMQPFEATLTVQVQQSAVVDPVLKVGQTTSSVEVFDATPVVTTDNPTLSKTLERQRIEQLPINGRSVYTLFQTIPGWKATAPTACARVRRS
jgi:hypothetical protein